VLLEAEMSLHAVQWVQHNSLKQLPRNAILVCRKPLLAEQGQRGCNGFDHVAGDSLKLPSKGKSVGLKQSFIPDKWTVEPTLKMSCSSNGMSKMQGSLDEHKTAEVILKDRWASQ
jgi:hypothetical protein